MDLEIIARSLMAQAGLDEASASQYAYMISQDPEGSQAIMAELGLGGQPFRQKFRDQNPRPSYDAAAMRAQSEQANAETKDPMRRGLIDTLTNTGLSPGLIEGIVDMADFVPFVGGGLGYQDTVVAADKARRDPTLGNIAEASVLGGGAFLGAVGVPGASRAAKAAVAAGKRAFGGATPPVNKLMMVHNQAAGSLPKSASLRSLAAPSAAITTPDVGLTDFGDISWIFDPDVAKKMSGSRTFARDAYTPRQPYIFPTFSRSAIGAVSNIAGRQTTKSGQMLAKDKEFANDVLQSFANSSPDRRDIENLAALYGINASKVDFDNAERLRQQLFLDLQDQGLPPRYKMNKETRYDSKTVDATASRMVSEMVAQGVRGGERGGMTIARAMAMATPELRTLKEVRDNAGRIKRLGSAEYQEALKPSEDLYNLIMAKIQAKVAIADPARNTWDLASEAAKDVFQYGRVRDKNLIEGLGGDDLSEIISDDVARFKSISASVPTEYLEKKFTKKVPMTAFRGAIIPEDAGPLVTKTLEDAGITRIETYGSHEERIAAFKKFPELLFSAAGAGGVFLASQQSAPDRKDPQAGLLGPDL